MRVFQVVGVQRSGKTTTIENLIITLRKRNFKVGTIKSINCPMFTIDQDPHTNTNRHKQAGASVVVATAKNETDFLFSEPLSLERILKHLSIEELDFVIVEGGYELDLPRIICLKSEEELVDRKTAKTFAIAGVIANNKQEQTLADLPLFNATLNQEHLVDFILKSVDEISFPLEYIERPQSCRSYCAVCKHHKEHTK